MSDLHFQDFSHEAKVSDVKTSTRGNETVYEFKHSGNIGDDKTRLLDDEEGEERAAGGQDGEGKGPGWWTFEYYQRFFDVDTDQVLRRLFHGVIPRVNSNFITDHIRPVPDLYGPFWISVTLVFVTAICGNISAYIKSAGAKSDYHWSYDFSMVTAAGTAVFVYVCLVPLALYSFLWWRKSEMNYTYLEILASYGYSIGIFIPVSILWVINNEILRWSLIGIAVFFSGAVLAFTFWPALKHDQKLFAGLALVGILVLHSILAVGFKEVFFKSQFEMAHSDAVDISSGPSLGPLSRDKLSGMEGTTLRGEINQKEGKKKKEEEEMEEETKTESKKSVKPPVKIDEPIKEAAIDKKPDPKIVDSIKPKSEEEIVTQKPVATAKN